MTAAIERPRGVAGRGHRAAAGWFAAALLAAAPAAQTQPPGEYGAGGLYFRTSPVAYAPATRLATDVGIEVAGIVARVSVAQRFVNDSTDWVEGVYVFPLPDDAAVDRLTMIVGDRRIEGEIQERERARRTYERARAAGQQASLVEQERPNLFTTSVANIAPGQEIEIEIGYLQTVAYDQGRLSLRFPMTLTPRYVPGSPLGTAGGAGWSFDTTRVPDASRITPPVLDPTGANEHLATITATVDAGLPLAEIGSTSHDVLVGRSGERHEVRLAAGPVAMDRDFVLDWRLEPGREPRAVAFTEAFDNESYVLLMFLPPEAAALPEVAPREMIFVIDTSGSMGGGSIEQAKAALDTALNRVTANDRFNVVEFNSATRALFPAPAAVTPETLSAASRFVASLQADGSTEMEPAIRTALTQTRQDGYLRQIVFITDGSVGNEAALFATIRRELGAARFFTVGIGAAPNSHFMRKAAQFGRGAFVHIGELDQVAPRMQELFDKLEHVALTDIELAWPNAAEVYPSRVPDLYRGQPVLVAARMDRLIYEPLALDTSGSVGRLAWSQRIGLAPGRSAGVAAIWGRRKIEALLDSRLEGADEVGHSQRRHRRRAEARPHEPVYEPRRGRSDTPTIARSRAQATSGSQYVAGRGRYRRDLRLAARHGHGRAARAAARHGARCIAAGPLVDPAHGGPMSTVPGAWRRRLQAAPVIALALAAVAELGAGLWIPAKAALAQHLLERAWDDAQRGRPDARPWPWADTTPLARLIVPSLSASWVVLSGSSGRNLAFAPTHMDGSARPGERGVSVIAGHRDTHFEVLEALERGAAIVLETTDGVVRRFEVVRIDIVNAEESRLRLDVDDALLVLVTCYPFDALSAGGPLRYVITALATAS